MIRRRSYGTNVDKHTIVLLHFDGDYKNYAKEDIAATPISGAGVSYVAGRFGDAAQGTNTTSGLTFAKCGISLSIHKWDEFTVEWYEKRQFPLGMFRFTSNNRADGLSTHPIYFGHNIGDATYYYVYGSTIGLIPNSSFSDWSHVAITKKGNTFSLFLNGVFVRSTTYDLSWLPELSDLYLFNDASKTNGTGRYNTTDEFRISDICRYDSNFTPPSKPFK